MVAMTVWYRIRDDRFPHCRADMVFTECLDDKDAENVAECLKDELRYILGDDLNVMVWAQ